MNNTTPDKIKPVEMTNVIFIGGPLDGLYCRVSIEKLKSRRSWIHQEPAVLGPVELCTPHKPITPERFNRTVYYLNEIFRMEDRSGVFAYLREGIDLQKAVMMLIEKYRSPIQEGREVGL